MDSRSRGPAGATTATRSPGARGRGLTKRAAPLARVGSDPSRGRVMSRLSYPPRAGPELHAREAARSPKPGPVRSVRLGGDGDEEATLTSMDEHEHWRALRVT